MYNVPVVATFRGHCLVCSELPFVWLLFEGGNYLRVASIQRNMVFMLLNATKPCFRGLSCCTLVRKANQSLITRMYNSVVITFITSRSEKNLSFLQNNGVCAFQGLLHMAANGNAICT